MDQQDHNTNSHHLQAATIELPQHSDSGHATTGDFQGQKQFDLLGYQHDVRMKRHPELQPYVPSDRFITFSTSSSTAGSGLLNSNNYTNYSKSPSSNQLGRQQQQVQYRNGKPMDGNLSSGQPKKFVSMTRLNQLAQPKKRLVVPAAPLSSNSSNRSINSLNRTINKTQKENNVSSNISSSYSRNDSAKQQPPPPPPPPLPTQQKVDNKARLSRTSQQQEQSTQQQTQTKQQERASLATKADDNTRRPRTSTASSQPGTKAGQQNPKSQQLKPQQEQKQQKTRRNSQPTTPIISTHKMEPPSTMMTPSSTTDLPSQTPQSSTPIARMPNSPRDHLTTPAIQPSPTPTLGVSKEEDRSPIENLDNNYQDHDDDDEAQHRNQLSTYSVHKRSINESSLAEQMSEVSINDPFYQSAASELVSESENNTSNGINFDRNTDSLFREIEQDLIAMGVKKDLNSHGAKMCEDFQDFDRRNSTATIVTESPNLKQNSAVVSLKDEQEEDDRRMTIEKELREKAIFEEEERKKRDQIVEKILSRLSQGS